MKIITSFTSLCEFFNQVFNKSIKYLQNKQIKNLINLLLTKLMNKNLLFSKFELSFSFDNSYWVVYVDYFGY